jgi:hypothetical protein
MLKKAINEEEYPAQINAGTFRTKEEAQRFLEYLRNKYNLSEYDSYINGTTVVVSLEKDMSDYSYFYDMVDAIKNERPENMYRQYGKVSESVDKRGMKQIRMYRAEFENACDDLYYGYGYKFWRTHNNSIEDESIARAIWKAAIDKMSQFESKTNKNMKMINEKALKKAVSESIKRTLNEFRNPHQPLINYEGNDLDESSIVDQAVKVIYDMEERGEDITWTSVAKNMGFRLDSLNDADMELLHDAIEHAMFLPGISDDELMNENAGKNMKKNVVKLNENTLRRIVAKSVKKALKESLNERGVYTLSSDKPRYDINGKRWNREFDKGTKWDRWMDDDDFESEKAAKEFLNRPNAARDFKNFPRYSRTDGGVKDYNDLKNGSPKIQALKQRRQQESETASRMEYLNDMLALCRDATRGNISREGIRKIEEMPSKLGWGYIPGEEIYDWSDDEVLASYYLFLARYFIQTTKKAIQKGYYKYHDGKLELRRNSPFNPLQ